MSTTLRLLRATFVVGAAIAVPLAKCLGLLLLLVLGYRRRFAHERRPWHVGHERDWTRDPI